MLCQICTRGVALVEARVGSNTAHICIPCALKIMDDDPETTLEMKRGLGGEKETKQLETDD